MFPTTQWTLVHSLEENEAEKRRAVLDALMQKYWKPLYHYARRLGHADASAEDVVQGFLTLALERDIFGRANMDKGSLRAFLKTSFRNYLVNMHEKKSAQKRGGQALHFSLRPDFDQHRAGLESALSSLPAQPDAAFNTAWAMALMRHALMRLRLEYESHQHGNIFDLIEGFMTGTHRLSYREAAEQHGFTVPGLKAIVHRARKRYRELLEDEVRNTVCSEQEMQSELQMLTTDA